MTRYELHQTPEFDKCVAEYHRNGQQQEIFHLQGALLELRRQPFGNPTLRTHPMKGVSGQKRYISYSGGPKGQRIIWAGFEKQIVLLLFGEHDPIERRAERLDLIIEPSRERIEIVERIQDASPSQARQPHVEEHVGALFVAWTDAELTTFGFDDHVVPVLRRMETDNDLFEANLAAEDERRAFNLLAYQDPDGRAAERVSDDEKRRVETVVESVVAEEERAGARAVKSPSSRKHIAPLTDEQIEALLAEPIEEWMVFLHPDQARLTKRPFSGPARVRGAAGTGKTVVALHRCKHLTERYDGRILFTTYVNNLPPVYEQLYRRLSPGDDRVDFLNLHKWAYRFLRDHGAAAGVDTKAVREAYRDAWKRAVASDGPLVNAGLNRAYMEQEVEWVIKGRAVTSLAGYLSLARTGRGTPLGETARREAWAFYKEYERQLKQRGTRDFADMLLKALELLEEGAESPYRAVVVDEAQDLTEVGVRICHLLGGGDRPDGLFLVGDGQQAVYPGGYSLGSVGIEVRGRSSLLRVNYRNTRQISALAQSLVADADFNDGDDSLEPGQRDIALVREGAEPSFEGFESVTDHDIALAARIEELAARDDTGIGDIAVLVPTNRMVRSVERTVQDLGLVTQRLHRYTGVHEEAVKVGTYQRAKGLEFKRVLLPRLDAAGLGEQQRRGEESEVYEERLSLLRNALFVAITRARDGVWGGWVGDPAALVADLVAEA